MLIRDIRPEEKAIYNQVVNHPIQSYEWGEFRKQTGVKVERLGFFDQGKLQKALTVTFHHLPIFNRPVGYFPRGFDPDADQLAALQQLADKHRALYIKLEPNTTKPLDQNLPDNPVYQILSQYPIEMGRALFTRYTFQLDLTPSEDQLLASMTSKTRYNTRLAAKKGVTVFEDSTDRGLEDYLTVLQETTNRQGFYAHSPDYFRKMWQELKDSGIVHIFKASYENQVLVAWIVFTFHNILYYPYGASTSQHRELMASNLMMWEVIKFGKHQGCTLFDMWGALGPNPDRRDPWYGFHRFKKGYGGELTEYLGSFDLVNDQASYKIYKVAEKWRWRWLRLKKTLSK